MNPTHLMIGQGYQNVKIPQGKHRLQEMQTDDMELNILVGDLYNHFGLTPRENARFDAQQLLAQVNHQQAYELAQQKFIERQYSYANGNVLERFRRFIGGHPLPPNPNFNYGTQYGMQPQAVVPPMYQHYQQFAQQQAPHYAPVPNHQEMDALKAQVNDLSNAVTNLLNGLAQVQQPQQQAPQQQP